MTAPSPLQGTDGLVSIEITLDGTTMPDSFHLLSARVQLGLRAIGRATLAFMDGDMPNNAFPVVDSGKLDIGTAVRIDAGYDGEVKKIFEGKITAVGSEVTGDNFPRTIVTVQDGGYDLLRNADVETFTNLSLRDIVSRFISKSGLTAGTIDLPTTPV